jgi:hypothetical protein
MINYNSNNGAIKFIFDGSFFTTNILITIVYFVPTNEQMIYDTAKDLKSKIKDIIIRNPFRNEPVAKPISTFKCSKSVSINATKN